MIAYNAIKLVQKLIKEAEKPLKDISLFINDNNKHCFEDLKKNISELETVEKLSIKIENHSFSDINNEIVEYLHNLDQQSRAFVFLDPFGYKDIELKNIHEMLRNGKTEIFLFLPTSDIRRFILPAISTNKPEYEPLKNLLNDLETLNNNRLIIDDDIKFINSIRIALSFKSKFYSSSHYLQRKNKQFYSLFFITSNIYGLEKFLETKYEKDPELGRGSRIDSNFSIALFDMTNYNPFESEIKETLLKIIPTNKFITNKELYEQILINQFIPKFVIPIVNEMFNKSIFIYDQNHKQLEKKPRSYYLKFDYFKEPIPRLYFQRRGD